MIMRLSLSVLLVLTMLGASSTVVGQEAPALDHREDFKMNSISGGDFRAYISDAVAEEDAWARSMRTFGTFHNHMHALMTSLARHGVEARGDTAHVPSFGARISGGDWGAYREALGADGAEGPWAELVQITEVMHDRVHHAMFKAVQYDHATRDRTVATDDYIGEGRAPYTSEEAVISPRAQTVRFPEPGALQHAAWHEAGADPHWHLALQQFLVFDELLDKLLHTWARHGDTHAEAACQPAGFGDRVTGDAWANYADALSDCPDDRWRHFVQVSSLMHSRIQHMLTHAVQYHTEYAP